MAATVEASGAHGSAGPKRVLTTQQRAVLGVISGAFIILGFQEGSAGALWPDVIDAFDVSKGAFGVASGIGLALGFPVFILGGRITNWFDKRLLLAVAFAAMGVAMLAVTAGAGFAALAAILAIRGVGICLLELAGNAVAMEIEQESNRHLMSLLHSGYSAGLVTGAGIAWAVLKVGLGFEWVFTLLALVLGLLALAALRNWRTVPRPRSRTEVAGANGLALGLYRRADIRLLALVCALAFCAELLIAQWITIYLRDERGYSASVGVAAVVLLGVSMFLGRLVNVPVTERLGAQRALLAQGGALTAGAVLLVVSESAAVTLAGCAVAGIGLAGMAPTALSLAGWAVPSAPGLASGASLIGGYLGLAIMPFVAGFIASTISVRAVLGLELLFGATVIAAALWLRRLSDAGAFEAGAAGAPAA